ncbi:MAG: hypothetical protein FWH27_07235 [Planctomycetaceae bacterium]|nr:hypothetical protein [Planctomycetaceae bacterium]
MKELIMDCSHTDKLKSKKSSTRILCVVVALLIAGGLFGYYWPHLLWKYGEWRLKPLLKDIKKISNSPMPIIDIPENWVEHSVGCVRFHLPPDMSIVNSRSAVESNSTKFHNEKISIRVTQDSLCIPEVLQAASRLHPTQKTFLTLSQLRLESYNMMPNDFHWSMSRREVGWHTFIISLRPVIVPRNVKCSESFSRRNWEGLLLFVSGELNHRYFDWQCISCPIHGTIYFLPIAEGQELDVNVMRGVIQSMEVSCGCFPKEK